MSSQQVPSSLRDILADILEISPDEVTPALGVGTVDSWDSFRHLQAILAIEGEDSGSDHCSAHPNRVGSKGSGPLTPEELGFKLRHVGVAVPSLGPATEALSTLFGYKVISGPFDDPIQKVSVNFLTQSDNDKAEIELIAPLSEDSPITSMLAKGSGGAYHLCFETTNIEQALVHAKNNGCVIVSPPVPAVAFNGRRIAWIYTRSRQLFELVEASV